MLSLPSAFRPLPVYEFASGSQLLGHVLTSRVAVRFGVAAAVLAVWRFWPAFEEKVLAHPAFRGLREFASWRWIFAEALSVASDCVAYTWAFRGLSEKMKSLMPTWQHALVIHEGYPLRMLPRIPPLNSFPYISFELFRDIHKVEHGPDLMRLALATAVKERTLPLAAVLRNKITNRNVFPFWQELGMWAMDTAMTFASRAGAIWVWQRCGARYPLIVSGLCTTLIPMMGGMVIGLTRGYLEQLFTQQLIARNQAAMQMILDNVDLRTTLAHEMEEEENKSLKGRLILKDVEKSQLQQVYQMAQTILCANRMAHGVRINVARSFRNLAYFGDAMERGEIDNGAANVLSKFSRTITFEASRGVESSVSSLTGPDAEGHTHTERCAVCIADYVDGESIVELVCGHLFHQECIKEWLAKHKECPLCRHDIRARAHSTTIQPAYSDAQVVITYLCMWAYSNELPLPRGFEFQSWGDTANLMRRHDALIPEPVLQCVAADFNPSFTGGNDLSSILLGSCGGIVFDLEPASLDR